MKRFVAILVAVMLVCALSVSAFALESPTAAKYFSINVSANGSGSAKSGVATIDPANPEVVVLTATEEGAAFVRWEITGDYEIVEGSLTTPVLKIRPHSDINAVAIFADGESVAVKPTPDKDSTSPKTGDSAVTVLSILALAALMGAFATRKVRG